MAISPLEARATESQLLEAHALEQELEGHLRNHDRPDYGRSLEFVSSHPRIVLCIVAERFRRTGWHVVVGPQLQLTFNDASPEI